MSTRGWEGKSEETVRVSMPCMEARTVAFAVRCISDNANRVCG